MKPAQAVKRNVKGRPPAQEQEVRSVKIVNVGSLSLFCSRPPGSESIFPFIRPDKVGADLLRLVDPALAVLPIGQAVTWKVSLAAGTDVKRHVVISFNEIREVRTLLRLYCRIFRRELIICRSISGLRGRAPLGNALSITVIPPFNLKSGYRWLSRLTGALCFGSKTAPALGILVAQTPEHLSWLLLKQLCSLKFQKRPIVGSRARTKPDHGDFVTDITVRGIAEVGPSTVVMNGHGRHHCGSLYSQGVRSGVCASPTRSIKGECVHGRRCFYRDSKPVSLEEVDAERVFFNACFSGRMSGTAFGLPTSATMPHAAARGRIAEYIGNYRAGRYNLWDIYWFFGLSHAGLSPALAVHALQAIRKAEGRQKDISALYFGDAVQRPWSVSPSFGASVTNEGQSIIIKWSGRSRFYSAEVAGKRWCRVGVHRQIRVCIRSGGKPVLTDAEIQMTPIPGRETSLIVAVFPSSPPPANWDLKVSLVQAKHSTQLPRCLLGATTSVNFLIRNGFATLGPDAILLRRSALSLLHLASGRPHLIHGPLDSSRPSRTDASLSHLCDFAIVSEAIAKSDAGWIWEDSYLSEVDVRCGKKRPTCTICRSPAHQYDVRSLTHPAIKRTQILCPECGLVADYPRWPFAPSFRLVRGSGSHIIIKVTVLVREHLHPFTVAVAVGPIGVQRKHPLTSDDIVYFSTSGTKTVSFESATPMSGFYWLRLYIVSKGQFGILSMPVFI